MTYIVHVSTGRTYVECDGCGSIVETHGPSVPAGWRTLPGDGRRRCSCCSTPAARHVCSGCVADAVTTFPTVRPVQS